MATHIKFEEQSIEAEIVAMLHDLSTDAKMTVMQFVRFLHDQKSKPLPTTANKLTVVSVPITSLSGFVGLLDPGYEGDALRDTEAYFDDL